MTRGDARGGRRWRRWLAGVAIALALAIVVTIGVAAWIAGHLETPVVKAGIVDALRDAVGYDIDYEQLSVGFGGIEGRGLRVRNPEPWRDHAPLLAEVRRIEARFAPLDLFRGTFRVRSVRLEGIAVAWVQDEEGHGSLDALPPSGPAPEGPGTPISRLLDPGDLDLVVEDATVTDVSLARILVRDDGAIVTDRLEGLELSGRLSAAGGAPSGEIRLRSPDGGVLRYLRVETAPGRQPVERRVDATLRARAVLDDARTARLEADAALSRQDLDPRGPVAGDLLGLSVAVAADPDAGRTTVTVSRLSVLAGLLEGTAAVDVFDRAAGGETRVEVRTADLRGDGGRIPAPVLAAFPGVELAGASLAVRIEALRLTVDGGLRFAGPVTARVAADRAAWAGEGLGGSVEGLALDAGATPGPEGTLALDLRALVRALEGTDDGIDAAARGLVLTARVAAAAPLDPFAAGGPDASARLEVQRLSANLPAGALSAGDLAVTLSGRVAPEAPWAASGEITAPRLSWDPRGGAPIVPGPVQLAWSAVDVFPDGQALARTRGRLRATLDAPWGHGNLDADLAAEPAVVTADLSAPGLGFVPGLLPRASRPAGVPWDRMSVSARLDARVADRTGASPTLDGTLKVDLDRPGASAGGHALAADRAALRATFRGPTGGPDVDATLALVRPRADGQVLAPSLDVRAKVRARPGRPSLDVVATAGRLLDAGMNAEVAGASMTVAGRVAVRGAAAWMSLAPAGVGDALDWERLTLDGTWNGRFTGIASVPAGGLVPRFAAGLDRARGAADVDASIDGVRYRAGGTEFDLEKGRVSGRLQTANGALDGRLTVSAGSGAAVAGGGRYRVRDFSAQVGVTRAAGAPALSLDAIAGVAEVSQTALPSYPVADVTLSARGRLVPFSAFRLDDLTVDNAAAGTRLRATAALDDAGAGDGPDARVPIVLGRKSLTLDGRLEQDLSRLTADPGSFRGTGALDVPFRVESGDRTLFRVTATVNARDVDADLPGAGIRVEGMNGAVSVVQEVALAADGRLSLVGSSEPNEYSRVRFPDLHPFLGRGSYVTFRRLDAGPVSAGPVAGNLRVAGRTFSLDQMEADWRGGKVSGQLAVDYRPGDTTVQFRGDVTGVRPGDAGDDDRLDANAALTVSLDRMEVEGRAQILSIGKGHLMDALAAVDPAWEDVAINRVRKYLSIGFPKFIRVRMDRGFLAAKVDLGGIASVVRIDEIRGVPTGPLLRRYLGPLVPKQGSTP